MSPEDAVQLEESHWKQRETYRTRQRDRLGKTADRNANAYDLLMAAGLLSGLCVSEHRLWFVLALIASLASHYYALRTATILLGQVETYADGYEEPDFAANTLRRIVVGLLNGVAGLFVVLGWWLA